MIEFMDARGRAVVVEARFKYTDGAGETAEDIVQDMLEEAAAHREGGERELKTRPAVMP